MGFPVHVVSDDVGHLPWIESVNLSDLKFLTTGYSPEEEVVAPRVWARSR